MTPTPIATQPVESRPVVLIVDDIPECVEMLGTVLQDEYTVRVATSGERALQMAIVEPVPDLVLLDVLMPDMDGHQVLAELRRDPRSYAIPVIFVTSLHESSDELAALAEGAADYIVKPALPAVVKARVHSQIELKRMRDRLQERNRALSGEVQARAAAEQKLQDTIADLRAFSYTVSHDLRAPLSAIAAFASAVRDSEGAVLSERARHRLDRVVAGSVRMNTMIDDILACTRADQCEMCHEPVDLRALAVEVADELGALWPKAQVTIGDLPVVQADRGMMRQVLTNLVGNAMKFSSRGPQSRVEIDARNAVGCHEVCVSDNGAGFDGAYADKLFKLFQRLHSDAEFPGSGVGLSIVKRLVARHGGKVSAQCEPGVRTTFAFTIA